MEGIDKTINLRLLSNERRRELDRVCALANIEALAPARPGNVIGSTARRVGRSSDTDAGSQSKIADINDVFRLGEGMHGIFEVWCKCRSATNHLFVHKHVERRRARDVRRQQQRGAARSGPGRTGYRAAARFQREHRTRCWHARACTAGLEAGGHIRNPRLGCQDPTARTFPAPCRRWWPFCVRPLRLGSERRRAYSINGKLAYEEWHQVPAPSEI